MVQVSVIIPNYNHAPFLQQRIESVLQQTFSNFELIILDDASPDNSRQIIEQYRRHDKVSHIVYNEVNGRSTFSQWHKGILLAQGKYIWLAESDDFADLTFLEVCMNKINACPELVLVFTDSCIVDEKNNVLEQNLDSWYVGLDTEKWKQSYTENGIKEIFTGLADRNTIPNASAVVFEKKIFTEVLGFRYCGDRFFWIKMLEKNGPMAFIKKSLNHFRSHTNTTRSAPYTLAKLKQYIKERSIILFYLEKNKLIDPLLFAVKRREIIAEWKGVFFITDVIKKDFYIPSGSPLVLIQFIGYKLNNAFARIKKQLAS